MQSPTRFVLPLALLMLPSLAQAGQPAARKAKVAVLDIKVVGAVDPQELQGLSALIASEASKGPARVISGADLSALLGFDRQKKLLGCSEGSCLAEIGGALGVDYLLTSEVSRVGKLYLLSLTLLDVARAQALQRLTRRAQSAEALVDVTIEAVGAILRDGLPPTSSAPAVATSPQPEPRPADAPVAAPPAAEAKAAKAPIAEATPQLAIEAGAPTSSRKKVGYALDGVGVALLAAGGAFGYLELQSYNAAKKIMEDAKAGQVVSKADFDSAQTKAKRLALAADVSYVLGAVCAGFGLYYTFSGAPVTVGAAPTVGGGGLIVAGGL